MSAKIFFKQALTELNKELFSPLNLRIDFLKCYPEWVPLIAEWEYANWHCYDDSLTKEKLINGFAERLHDDKLPLTLLLFKAVQPIGLISLEDQTEPELADLEDGNPWGGSFHIIPEERGKKLAETAAKALTILAKRLGHQKIWFYTSNPRNVKWYTRQGAHTVTTRPFRGHEITVMKYDLCI
ncbi:MAG: GNAT family N-acetyltransferase [Chlamydiales bacterium]|nr:GNAT family N-acetyltransferase [Chlamydiales bacterium]